MVEHYVMYPHMPEAILFFGLTIGAFLMLKDYRDAEKRNRYRK